MPSGSGLARASGGAAARDVPLGAAPLPPWFPLAVRSFDSTRPRGAARAGILRPGYDGGAAGRVLKGSLTLRP